MLKNIIIFDINHIDLSNPIEELPENSSIDEISLTKLPADFNHLMPVEITANGSCLMNSLSFIFTATDDFSIHFRLATLLEMIINYKFYLTQRIFEQDYIYSNPSFNRTTNCNNYGCHPNPKLFGIIASQMHKLNLGQSIQNFVHPKLFMASQIIYGIPNYLTFQTSVAVRNSKISLENFRNSSKLV